MDDEARDSNNYATSERWERKKFSPGAKPPGNFSLRAGAVVLLRGEVYIHVYICLHVSVYVYIPDQRGCFPDNFFFFFRPTVGPPES